MIEKGTTMFSKGQLCLALALVATPHLVHAAGSQPEGAPTATMPTMMCTSFDPIGALVACGFPAGQI